MESNCRFMKKGLALSAATLLALGAIGNAQANVIAVSIDTINNFSISSSFSATEAPISSTATDSARFTGFPTVGNSATVVLSANPPQATSGPGPFPGQDVYTQPPAGGFVGSRGDAQIISSDFNGPGGFGAQNLAETRLSAGTTGGASGTNQKGSTIQLNGAQTVTFSFTADPYLQVGVDQAGETAFADLQVTISLTLGGGQAFLWTPDLLTGNDFGVATQTNPFSLNQTLDISSPAGNQTVNPGPGNFTATSGTLAGGTYTLNISLSETVRGIAGPATVVPEPSALLLLIAGLAGLAGVSARRARPRK